MNGATFRDWFKSCFLPHANRLEGRKALTGDSLPSDIDADVLNMWAENDIGFIDAWRWFLKANERSLACCTVGMETAKYKTIHTVLKDIFAKLLKKI